MNWYKYWYFTIYFIYDHFSKSTEDNRIYSIGLFSLIIYMLFAVLGCFIDICLDFGFIKYITHPFSHLIFILIAYLVNSLLFNNEINAKKGRMLYKEIRTRRKNIFFILLTIGVVFTFYCNVIFLKECFFYTE